MKALPPSTIGKLADSLLAIAPSPSDVLKEAFAGGLTAGLGGLISVVLRSLFGIRDRVDRLGITVTESASQIDMLVVEPVHTAYREYERLLPFIDDSNAQPPDWIVTRGHAVLDMLIRALTIQELSRQGEERRVATLLFCGVCARKLIGSRELARSYVAPVLDATRAEIAVLKAQIAAQENGRLDVEAMSAEVRRLESSTEHNRRAYTERISNHYPHLGTRGELLGMPRQSEVKHEAFVSGELKRARQLLSQAVASRQQLESRLHWLVSIETEVQGCLQ